VAVFMRNGPCGSKHQAVDEYRAEIALHIDGRLLGDKLRTADDAWNLG
jgi:hypothetical protein